MQRQQCGKRRLWQAGQVEGSALTWVPSGATKSTATWAVTLAVPLELTEMLVKLLVTGPMLTKSIAAEPIMYSVLAPAMVCRRAQGTSAPVRHSQRRGTATVNLQCLVACLGKACKGEWGLLELKPQSGVQC